METIEVVFGEGGSIELAVDVKWLELGDEDLAFVRGLVAQLRAHGIAAPVEAALEPPDRFFCNYAGCNRTFTSTQGRQVHFARAHTQIAKPKTQQAAVDCPECGRTFQSEPAMRGHMSVHKNKGLKIEATYPPQPTSLVDRIVKDSEPFQAHRLADISKRGNAWQAMCLCGESYQAVDKNDAREALREHCDAA